MIEKRHYPIIVWLAVVVINVLSFAVILQLGNSNQLDALTGFLLLTIPLGFFFICSFGGLNFNYGHDEDVRIG